MALTPTRMLEMRPNSNELDKNMNRASRYGCADTFVLGNGEAQSIISPELAEQAARSAGRTVKVPVLDHKDITLGSTRSVTIADDDNTSAFYTVTWTTITGGFTLVPGHHNNNDITLQRDFEKKYDALMLKMASSVDTTCSATLEANKSQVFGDTLIYTNTSDTIIATDAQKLEFMGDATVIMEANDYYSGNYRVVGNSGMKSIAGKYIEYGKYNNTNKDAQLGDKTFHYTNRLANGAGQQATGYVVNPGNVGFLVQHEVEALVSRSTKDGHEWGMMMHPYLGVPMDWYSYEGVSDESTRLSESHLTRVYKEHHAFALTFATVVAYNTDLATHASPIFKFAVTNP